MSLFLIPSPDFPLVLHIHDDIVHFGGSPLTYIPPAHTADRAPGVPQEQGPRGRPGKSCIDIA